VTDDGLRERKKRETRAALSQATIRLCVQRGWEDVSLADIADAANVSERTFRNYFASKAEAIAASHLERALRTADELRARPVDESLWDAIKAAVVAQYGGGASGVEPAVWLARIRVILAEPAVRGEVLKADAIAQEELATAIAERTGLDMAEDVYPRLAAAVVSAGNATVLTRWLRDPHGSVVPLLESALDQIRAGLPVPGTGDRS